MSDETSFREALERLVNAHSRENGSNTPDFILAEYLCTCLAAFDVATRRREQWYGRGDAGTGAPLSSRAVSWERPPQPPTSPEEIEEAKLKAIARMADETPKGQSVAGAVLELHELTMDEREKRATRSARVTAGAAAVLDTEIARTLASPDYTTIDGVKWAVDIGEMFADELERREREEKP
jgi:hypothetical protein